MLITNEEAKARIDSDQNILRRKENDKTVRQQARIKLPEHEEDKTAIAPSHNGGRRPGDRNITPESRASIGADANIKTLAEVASEHQVSLHHAHELSHAKHSNAQGVNPELSQAITDKLAPCHDTAVKKLAKALLSIKDKELEGLKPKELAIIASQLSKVAENTAPIKHKDGDTSLGDCRLIVYSPTVKTENFYETVQVERAIPAET